MKIATVGTSDITRKMISAIRKKTDLTLQAVYSRDREKAKAFALEHGAPLWFDDLNAMAACRDVDTVYIASPNAFHFRQAKLFLEHGKHVLCEKPMTATKDEQDALYELADRQGLILVEAIMPLWAPVFPAIKKALGEIGTVRAARLTYCQLSSKYPAFLRGETPNIFNPAMQAGALMDIGVYPLYVAAALFGKPDAVLSDAVFLSSGADAAGSVILKYGDKTVSVDYSKVAQGFAPSEILGDAGTVQIDAVSQLGGVRILRKDGQAVEIHGEADRDEVMGAEANAFMKLALEGPSPLYDEARTVAGTVREITDEVRRQNGFPF